MPISPNGNKASANTLLVARIATNEAEETYVNYGLYERWLNGDETRTHRERST